MRNSVPGNLFEDVLSAQPGILKKALGVLEPGHLEDFICKFIMTDLKEALDNVAPRIIGYRGGYLFTQISGINYKSLSFNNNIKYEHLTLYCNVLNLMSYMAWKRGLLTRELFSKEDTIRLFIQKYVHSMPVELLTTVYDFDKLTKDNNFVYTFDELSKEKSYVILEAKSRKSASNVIKCGPMMTDYFKYARARNKKINIIGVGDKRGPSNFKFFLANNLDEYISKSVEDQSKMINPEIRKREAF